MCIQHNKKSFSLKTMEDGQVLLYSVSAKLMCYFSTATYFPFLFMYMDLLTVFSNLF